MLSRFTGLSGTLHINVGERGYNGVFPNPSFAGGGGASDIRRGGITLNDRIIVAGGGGGGGGASGAPGGDGGDAGLSGQDGLEYIGFPESNGGKGGTQFAGGAGDGFSDPLSGADGIFGFGGDGYGWGGSGGDGMYGGGGGGENDSSPATNGGGGGGSSYSSGDNTTYETGANAGNGRIIIYQVVGGAGGGGGTVTGSGTVNTIPLFSGSGSNLGNSALTQDASSGQVNAAGNLGVLGKLKVRDTVSPSHYLVLSIGDLTAERTLTLNTGNRDRTLTFSGNPTLGDWFDQPVMTTDSPTFAGLTITGGTLGAGKVLTSSAADGVATWQTPSSGIPAGAIMFFDSATCPAGWSEPINARGRYLVGLPASGTLAGAVGTALSDLENRPTGQHVHIYNETPSSASQGDGGGFSGRYEVNSTARKYTEGTWTDDISGIPASVGTNAPYIQYLVCKKN